MSDIFISYAHTDRTRAQALAAALVPRGWLVWWDEHIVPGREFDVAIDNALSKAKVIVVLWSAASSTSNWVKEEAEEGAKRGILVPVQIDSAPIPRGFRRYQSASLSHWNGDVADTAFQAVCAAIAAYVPLPRALSSLPGATENRAVATAIGTSRAPVFDVFVSHSLADTAFAGRLCIQLEDAGLRCWIAPRDIGVGVTWGQAILNGLQGSRAFVLVLSPSALASPQVQRELERAESLGAKLFMVRIAPSELAGIFGYIRSACEFIDCLPDMDERSVFTRLASILKVRG